MNISIRSEADSRILVYPLIRALYNYGSICVITNNVYLNRLIDIDTMEGGFRNVRVIVQPDGDIEEAHKQDDWYDNMYDFVIYDNMGFPDFDIECVIITSRVSESYLQDIVWIISEPGTKIFRFGQGVGNKSKKEPSKKPAKKSGKNGEETEESTSPELPEGAQTEVLDGKAAMEQVSGFNEDGTLKNKWTEKKTDAEILNEKLKDAQAVVLPFPSFEDIEKMECRWILPKIEPKLAKLLYTILKDYINVDERTFTKGVSTLDEGGNFISGADVR